MHPVHGPVGPGPACLWLGLADASGKSGTYHYITTAVRLLSALPTGIFVSHLL